MSLGNGVEGDERWVVSGIRITKKGKTRMCVSFLSRNRCFLRWVRISLNDEDDERRTCTDKQYKKKERKKKKRKRKQGWTGHWVRCKHQQNRKAYAYVFTTFYGFVLLKTLQTFNFTICKSKQFFFQK